MHQLHRVVGDSITKSMPPEYPVVRDPACGGDQNIPLFCCPEKSAGTEYCDVDLLVLKEKRVRVIVEIEEANITPIQLLGKFLASALSRYFIHDRWGGPMEMGDSVLFIQIVDTSKLKQDVTY